MKKVLFLTFYDPVCLGVRQLSAIAKAESYDSYLVVLKRDTHNKPLFYGKGSNTYTYFHEGVLRSSILAASPITDGEKRILLQHVKGISPDVVCLSTRSFGKVLANEIITEIKKMMPDVPVVGGGWGPTVEPGYFLKFCDYVCFGEGEKALVDILGNINSGKSLSKINNLIYSKNGELVHNPVFPPLTPVEMDGLPFADFDQDQKYLIDNDKLIQGSSFQNHKIYDCMAGRGCPLSCSYCMSGMYRDLYSDKGQSCSKFRIRSPEVVIEELVQAKKRGAITIRIKDEVFPFNKKWLAKFNELYAKKIGLPFFGYLRPEFHKEETIKKLSESGLNVTLIGIQSGSEDTLQHVYTRKLSKEKVIKFATLCHELNIQHIYHLIAHNPFEGIENMEETYEFCKTLPYSPMHVFRLVVFPGSKLENMIKERKPKMMPYYIYDWYSILYCFLTHSDTYRSIGEFIHKTGFMKRFPYVLQIFFLGPLIKELWQRHMQKIKYKTSGSLTVPTAKE